MLLDENIFATKNTIAANKITSLEEKGKLIDQNQIRAKVEDKFFDKMILAAFSLGYKSLL